MEARPFLFLCRNDTVGEVFMDERLPAGALFIASIQPEVDGKAYRTTEVIAGHRIVGQRICVVAVVVMAVHVVKETAPLLAQGVIEYQGCVGLLTADPFRLLGEVSRFAVGYPFLEPGRFRKKTG